MNRRSFCRLAAGGLATTATGAFAAVPTGRTIPGAALVVPPAVRADGHVLVAAEEGDRWSLGGSSPGPTLRTVVGEQVRLELQNHLAEPTIVHWHGLDVPEAADGHPRLAIAPGATYRYAFEVVDRPGTYWYHPHTHRRTAPQTYRGMVGFLLVAGAEEEELPLPGAAHDLPLLLQDRRLGDGGRPVYAPFGPDLMFGYMGEAGFVNGGETPELDLEPRRYRLRFLNGSNARILSVGFADDRPFTLIGADGGLLPAPIELRSITLATGERADVLVDLSGLRAGTRLRLVSKAFEIPGMMGMGMGMGGRGRGGRGMGPAAARLQGAPLELLGLTVRAPGADDTPPEGDLPARLSTIPDPPAPEGLRRRTFEFDSRMMRHHINGRPFEMERIDFEVPLGEPEIWELRNPSALPHPVHVHAGQFHVLSRRGGRDRVMPWESGLKDTVLLLPGERVEIAVRFAHHRGRYLMHCHNLEHEDAGMMLNFAVV